MPNVGSTASSSQWFLLIFFRGGFLRQKWRHIATYIIAECWYRRCIFTNICEKFILALRVGRRITFCHCRLMGLWIFRHTTRVLSRFSSTSKCHIDANGFVSSRKRGSPHIFVDGAYVRVRVRRRVRAGRYGYRLPLCDDFCSLESQKLITNLSCFDISRERRAPLPTFNSCIRWMRWVADLRRDEWAIHTAAWHCQGYRGYYSEWKRERNKAERCKRASVRLHHPCEIIWHIVWFMSAFFAPKIIPVTN